MKAQLYFRVIVSYLIVSLLFVASVSSQNLSGRVYQGNTGTEPPTSTPLSGVTVSLYESNDPNSLGLFIRSTTTNSSGWYSLETEGGQQYYFIVESDPWTHYSVGATSVSGTVVNSNRIRYSAPLTGKTLSGNKFWDKLKAPEMDVQGNSTSIADGDGTPSTTDGTDFGSVSVTGDSVAHTFTIKNTGSVSLNLTGSPRVAISGTHASDFSVVLQPSTPVASGGNTTFMVLFNPSAAGVRSASISIANNDANENPYNFSIQGTGTGAPAGAPEMDVKGNFISISDGDATPSTTDGTDFGSVTVTSDSIAHTFLIKNSGSASLNLTGSPRVVIGGTHASDFSVIQQPSTPVKSYDSTSFRVLFNPSAAGVRSASVSIANNDANENPYNFSIQGTGKDGAGKGTIIVEKQTIPNGAPDLFTFTGDAAGAISDGQQIVVSSLDPGTYTSQESVPSGWTLTSITFDDANSSGDLTTATATFRVEAGETVKAVFTNTQTDTSEYGYDFGDAPDPTYPTLLANNGARHLIDWKLYLGMNIDAELDGQPNANADGDDTSGSPDEDGVLIPTLIPGSSATIQISASDSGVINAWIDFNGNGSWSDAGEQIIAAQPVFHGVHSFVINVPAQATIGQSFARFRLSSARNLSFDGSASDGEVEDYSVNIGQGSGTGEIRGIKWNDLSGNGQKDSNEPGIANWQIVLDYNQDGVLDPSFGSSDVVTLTNAYGQYIFTGITPGQYIVGEMLQSGWQQTFPKTIASSSTHPDVAPYVHSVTISSNQILIGTDFGNYQAEGADVYDFGDAPDPTYPTLLSSNGARHIIDPDVFLGSSVESDPDGQPSLNAQGDDADGSDDEDGVMFTSPLVPGTVASVKVTASVQGLLYGWIDFQQDGQFDVSTDHVFTGQVLSPGLNVLGMAIPANAMLGFTYARFRFSQNSVLDPDGLAPDGEVEDYLVEVTGEESGSVTIIKEADPQDSTEFLICVDYAPGGFFSTLCQKLSDPSNKQWVLMNPSNVQSVSESPTSGWTLSDIQVTGDTDSGSVVNVSSYSVTVDFDPGENIVITFKNEKDGGEGYDFGDAPAPYPSASHLLGGHWLGDATDAPDAETGMQRDAHALGDDNDGNDDEDGLYSCDLIRGTQTFIEVETHSIDTKAYTLGNWIDFNGDGDWDDPGESVFPMGFLISQGPSTKTYISWLVHVPSNAVVGMTFARFRMYYDPSTPVSPSGYGGQGEVCDYEVEIKADGDSLPEGGLIFGSKWNDLNGDGSWDTGEPPLPGWTIWLDANQNGIEDTGDQYFLTDANGQFMFTGLAAGSYMVGEEVQAGWTQTHPGSPGTHTVTVDPTKPSRGILFGNYQTEGDVQYDFGDAPSSYGSAFHQINPNVSLGATVDAENTPLHSSAADGDDLNNSDDEDGVTFFLDLVPGHPSQVNTTRKTPNVTVTETIWIDLDQDGVFQDPAERIFPPTSHSHSGLVTYVFQIPAGAKLGKTFARARLYKSSGGVVPSPTGFGGEGEVEDYEVEIKSEGNVPPEGAVVSGMKWNDMNGNGLRDSGEPGLANWTIWIDLNGNGMNDPGESTLTNMNGQFFLFGLQPGTYTVYEELQSGWIQTYPGGTGTHTVSVTSGQSLTGLLFGNKEEGSGDFGATKWSQPPLVGEIPESDTTCFWGWRETSTQLMPIAADDWFCYDPRPVTAIRWWGGYADWDTLTAPPNAPAQFHIGVWTDVPRWVDWEWSHPGEMIHEWIVDRSSVNESPRRCVFYPGILENPITGFEYLFQIPQDDWFHQDGDSTIYWLSIFAVYETDVDSYHWGWLTREHYFHDDAVRMDFTEPVQMGSIFENGEPIGERWDRAFELGTDEYLRVFDYGDAPETDYATRFENNGAHHLIDPGIFMGGTVDQDSDGQPHIGALGDDDDGQDDEDGVEFAGTLTIGEVNEVTVQVSSSGFLSVWLDLDRDGNWYEPHDLVIANIELEPGLHTILFDVMEEAQAGETVARFRFSTESDLWFNGFAMNGEVEDYVVELQAGAAVEDEQSGLPSECMLYSNYPNPFNPSTKIKFALPQRASVTLEIYNIRGSNVKTLVDGIEEPGFHTVIWDGKNSSGGNVSSGIYLCRMRTSGFQKTIRMLFLK